MLTDEENLLGLTRRHFLLQEPAPLLAGVKVVRPRLRLRALHLDPGLVLGARLPPRGRGPSPSLSTVTMTKNVRERP
ncbi:MAG TPA: hypothetical protein VK988_10960 [Acidimicrobiales bacterium]|nr:hypothetical protein [Acidimicrobiales bacterium]